MCFFDPKFGYLGPKVNLLVLVLVLYWYWSPTRKEMPSLVQSSSSCCFIVVSRTIIIVVEP